MLAEAGESWPVCDCCGLPKKWDAERAKKQGGSWKLRCTHRRNDAKYYWEAYRTPNKYAWHRGLRRIDERMQKYIEGTEENKQYKERIYASWTKSAGLN